LNWPIPNMQNADYFSILVIVSVVLIFSVLLLSINLGVTLAKLKNTFKLTPSIILIIIAVSAGAYLVATVTNKTYEYVKSVEENPENYKIITKEISAEDLNSLTIRGDYNNKFDVKFVESDSPVIRVIGNKYSIEHLDVDVLHTGSVFINGSFNRFSISLLYNPVTIEIGINKFQTLNLNGIQSLESEVALDIDVITITQFYGTSLDLDVTSDDLIISNHNKLTARLAGEVNKLQLSMYGISEIDALELKSEETILNIYNYKSKITVNSEKISYSGGRFAEVIYKGDPEILNLDQKYQYNNYQDNDSIDLIKLK
jgi:hypothetical protein